MQDVVQCEYDKLQKVASEFEEAGQRVHQILQQIQSQQQVLQSGGWIAPSASRFYVSMNDDVNPGIGRLFQALKEASSALHEISSKFQQADEEASGHLRF